MQKADILPDITSSRVTIHFSSVGLSSGFSYVLCRSIHFY